MSVCAPSFLSSGFVKYKVWVQGASTFSLKVDLVDKDGRSVATSSEQAGVLKVPDVKLWWPYLMHESPGYLYSLEVGPAGGSGPAGCSTKEFGLTQRSKTAELERPKYETVWFDAAGIGARCEGLGWRPDNLSERFPPVPRALAEQRDPLGTPL